MVLCFFLPACAMEKYPSSSDGSDAFMQEEEQAEDNDPDPGGSGTLDPSWDAGLVVDTLPIQASWGTLRSSSRLKVQWDSNDAALAFEVSATFGDHSVRQLVDLDRTATVLTGLRSDTSYSVKVGACEDVDCWRSVSSETVDASTALMAWQVVGEGSSFTIATPIIQDSDTKGFGLYFGDDAPTGIAGTVQLYYDSSTAERKGVSMATSTLENSEVADMLTFTAVESHGLYRGPIGAGASKGPLTHQAIPMSGGGIRLFFEGVLDGTDTARLYSIDSQDGDRGHDFHPGAETECLPEDIAPGGACEPTLVLGGVSDGNPSVEGVHQSKLLYPMFDGWRWDLARGTAMLTTLHFTGDSDCSSTHNNMGMAVWNGSIWVLKYNEEGACPLTLPGIESPMPVHMGEGRYMVVFNANEAGQMDVDTSKPLQVIYADAAATGEPDVLEWSDFEDRDAARDLQTFWPSGIEIPDVMESKLDDFGIFSPTGEQDNLVMFANMSCADDSCAPFVGQLGWLNP
jgi:hypothetical protein